MDTPSTDMAAEHITTIYNLRAKHKIILSSGASTQLDKNELVLFSSLCFGGVSKDLSHFQLGYRADQLPRAELPRSGQLSRTVKSVMSRRQRLMYERYLGRAMLDLDSRELSRVLPCIDNLLRLCNHADFRQVSDSPGRVFLHPVSPPDVSTYPKLIRDFATEVANRDRENFDEIVQSASRLSWCPKPVNDMVPVKEDEVTNSPKMLIIKQEETPKSVMLPTSNFGSTLHLDTINAFRLKFNQNKGKRKGPGVENFVCVRFTIQKI